MIRSEIRAGTFTSSNIYKLMSKGKKAGEPGAPFYEYIAERNMERRLGRLLTDESAAMPLVWGKCAEKRVCDLLGVAYAEISQESLVHPEISCWTGSPDNTKDEDGIITVGEIKSPFTLKSFCQMVDCIKPDLSGIEIMNAIREEHKSGEQYYWQCLSNAILTGAKFAELIIYVPYFSELNEIRAIAQDMPPEVMGDYYKIANSGNDDVPWLVDGGFYQSVNKIKFEVPEADKAALTERVLLAANHLIPA